MYQPTKQTKESAMRTIYIKRRIAVVLAIATFISGLVSVINSSPSFQCEQGQEILQPGQRINDIAQKRCKGDITEAVGYILQTNDIKQGDITVLMPGTVITIKKGK